MACNPPSKMQSGVVRNFEEKSVGEGEKILILKGGLGSVLEKMENCMITV